LGKDIYVIPEKCTGCRICEMVCSFQSFKEYNPALSRIHVVTLHKEGLSIPILCKRCDPAPCIEACPTEPEKALYKTGKFGIIAVKKDLCIACKSCVIACPFGAIRWNDDVNLPLICHLCGGKPKCVEFCPTKALEFIPTSSFGKAKRYEYASKVKAF